MSCTGSRIINNWQPSFCLSSSGSAYPAPAPPSKFDHFKNDYWPLLMVNKTPPWQVVISREVEGYICISFCLSKSCKETPYMLMYAMGCRNLQKCCHKDNIIYSRWWTIEMTPILLLLFSSYKAKL